MKSMLGLLLFITAFASCKKDLDGTPETKPGNLSIERIQPDSASGGAVLIVKGSGLGQISSVMFEKDRVPATFNPVFNTADALVFRVPDTASGGVQNIIFTNTDGKTASTSFRVIALPSVTAVSSTEFVEGTEITLTGINFEDVSKVVLDGTTAQAQVVSKSKKQLVIKMPATTLSRAKLAITNASGLRVTDQEFVYVDNSYKIFADAMNANVNNSSWSTTLANTSEMANVKFGATALKAEYTGSWGGLQLIMNTPVDLTGYKYVTFWVKGAAVEKNISFNFNWTNSQTLTIPANKWTYFKVDLQTFQGAGVTKLETFVLQVNGDPATFYLDNILLVK